MVKGSKRIVRMCLFVLGFTSVKWLKVPDFKYTEGGAAQGTGNSLAQPGQRLNVHETLTSVAVADAGISVVQYLDSLGKVLLFSAPGERLFIIEAGTRHSPKSLSPEPSFQECSACRIRH